MLTCRNFEFIYIRDLTHLRNTVQAPCKQGWQGPTKTRGMRAIEGAKKQKKTRAKGRHTEQTGGLPLLQAMPSRIVRARPATNQLGRLALP